MFAVNVGFTSKNALILAKTMMRTLKICHINAYSSISIATNPIEFSINDCDPVALADVDDVGFVNSVVCKVKFMSETMDKTYFKDGKHRTDKMKAELISDESNTLVLTIWFEMFDLIKEDNVLQLVNLSARNFNEKMVLTTNFSTAVCFLTITKNISINESVYQPDASQTDDEVELQSPIYESLKLDEYLASKVCKGKITI